MTAPQIEFAITRIVHRDCEECEECAEQAITTALVTGSIGGTFEIAERRDTSDQGGTFITHGARVMRAHLWNGLRREHQCQVRRTSSTLSPLCGKPAVDLDAVHLWHCEEHRRDLGWAVPDRGVLPAARRRYMHWLTGTA